jgi:hypothetical protein
MERRAGAADHAAVLSNAPETAMSNASLPARWPHADEPVGGPALSSCDPDRPEDDGRYGGGWFDSSLDLREGLLVTEYMSFAALARELPPSWQGQ